LTFICLAGFLALSLQAQIPAFPGAEGFGAYATGGRGGDVYYVSNLNNNGPGSFADALATVPDKGRTIVFSVSGYIPVNKTKLAKSKVTIAGQTAPGDGIGLKGGSFIIAGNDVVIRHVRFRYGDQQAGGDCINIERGVTNLMMDHISMQFSTDENMSSFDKTPRPDLITMQWSLNAWGLETHSCGGLWDVQRVTTHHTLWAHNHTRNPKARPNGLLDWINNVTFDWDIGFIMGDSRTPASWKANVRGNYFVCPPGNIRSAALQTATLDRDGNPNFTLHADANLFDKNGNNVLDGADLGYGIASGSYATSTVPIVAADRQVLVRIDPPLTAYKKIVSQGGALRLNAGDNIPLRDEVDTILIHNLTTLKRNHVSHESQTGASNNGMGTLNSTPAPLDTDLDGMPDFWESSIKSNPNVANNNDLVPTGAYVPNTPAGYTLLEEYLHFRAMPHGVIGTNATLEVDLRKFAGGFNKPPVVFTLSNIANGTAIILADGHTARFTPPKDFQGRGGFEFHVADGDGSFWKQTFAVLVSSASSRVTR
jgi:pectate lyase